MPELATVVPITEEQRTPKAREERLNLRAHEAARAVVDEIEVYEPADQKLLRERFIAYRLAEGNLRGYWERRASKAEIALRRVLGMDLTDAQRDEVLAGLGLDKRRDRRTLSEHENALIDDYRRMPGADRKMGRVLFERLAAMTERISGCDPVVKR